MPSNGEQYTTLSTALYEYLEFWKGPEASIDEVEIIHDDLMSYIDSFTFGDEE